MVKYLLELRNRSILLIITFFSVLLICYLYKHVLLFLMTQMHLNEEGLYFIFTDVTELFSIYFKIGFFFTTQLSLWCLIYHVFSFLTNSLYFSEFKVIRFLWFNGTFFWFFSNFFSSYILIPFSWSFFLSFQAQQGFYFEARIKEYLVFYMEIYFLCLLYCQVFVLLFVFLRDIQQNYYYIKRYRKFYYYIFLFFATMVTPPDLISQVATTFFLILIYEMVLLVLLFIFYVKLIN